jgi:putative N6-adenine-specific DNA methylase
MTLNLECRLPQRVLAEVAEGPYRDENDLYELARSVDWTQWITPEHTLRVDTTAQRSPLKSLNFAALRIKDAVCDAMRDASGERPSVDTRQPDLPLLLHLGPERASLYVDTSGEPLFKRGWREDKGDAPLKETLAAAMLAAAGWRGTPQEGGALHDPCCGSGTIAIEAAQIACGIAPGLKRRFAFERLLPFASPEMRAQWQRLKSHAQSRIHASAVPIVASDVSFRMVDFARRNAQRAGVEAAITFHGGDALERPAPTLPADLAGTLMLNPPYGERIDISGKAARPSAEDRDTPDDFFPRLATHWKRAYTAHPAGWTAYVLSPDMKLPSAMRLKEARRTPMWNGPIECRLFRFDLVAGSMRGGPAS